MTQEEYQEHLSKMTKTGVFMTPEEIAFVQRPRMVIRGVSTPEEDVHHLAIKHGLKDGTFYWGADLTTGEFLIPEGHTIEEAWPEPLDTRPIDEQLRSGLK